MYRNFHDLGSIAQAAKIVHEALDKYGSLGASTNQLRDDTKFSYNTVRSALTTMELRGWIKPIYEDRAKKRGTRYHVIGGGNQSHLPEVFKPLPDQEEKYASIAAFWRTSKTTMKDNKLHKAFSNPQTKLMQAVDMLFYAASQAQYAVDSKIPESQRDLRNNFLSAQKEAHELLREVRAVAQAIQTSAQSVLDNPSLWTESPKQMADLLMNDPVESAEENHEIVTQRWFEMKEFFEHFEQRFYMEEPFYNRELGEKHKRIQRERDLKTPPVGHFEVDSEELDVDELFVHDLLNAENQE